MRYTVEKCKLGYPRLSLAAWQLVKFGTAFKMWRNGNPFLRTDRG